MSESKHDVQLAAPPSGGPAVRIGELYSYPEGRGWCRHGLLKVEDSRDGLVLRDTYWSGHGQNDRLWKPEELAGKIAFVLDLSSARKTYRQDYERYSNEDRAYIPMGGHSEEFWVRKDAVPDSALVERQLLGEIESSMAEIRHANWKIERARIQLAKLSTGPAHAPDGAGASSSAASNHPIAQVNQCVAGEPETGSKR